MSTQHPNSSPLYSIAEAQKFGSFSKSTFYRLAASGKLDVVKAGSRSFVKADSLHRYIENLPAASFARC